MLKEEIRQEIAKGYRGIAFKNIGYRNQKGCGCDYCRDLIQKRIYPGKALEEVEDYFYEESLYKFYEKVVLYARSYAQSMNRSIMTTCLLCPDFLPNITALYVITTI